MDKRDQEQENHPFHQDSISMRPVVTGKRPGIKLANGLPTNEVDQDVIFSTQQKKLTEMRLAQMNYFDSRMIELQERRQELENREASVVTKEGQLKELAKRQELERSELNHIRQLLRVENESLRMSSKDLRDQIRKYEVVIKMMMRGQNRPLQVTEREI